MKGYKRERAPGVWQLIVPVGKYPNGLTRYRSRTFRGTKRQAETALADFVVSAAKGGEINSGPKTVEAVLRGWLEARAVQMEPATVQRYETALRHIVRVLGKKRVAALRTKDIEDFYTQLVRQGQSGASLRRVHGALRQSLAWAKRRGYVASIATEGIELPPLGSRDIQPPELAHVRKVLDVAMAEDPDFGTLIALVAVTGCRRGEVCGLRWKDVDLVKGGMKIQRTIAAIPGGAYEKGTKTGEKRAIALAAGTVGLLQDHLMRCRERAASVDHELPLSAFVFSPDPVGEAPWHPQTISHRFARSCRTAGVPVSRLHDLRHLSATTLLKHGASIGEVMDRHGWKSLAMVTRYRHLLDAQDRKAAELLEQALNG